MTAVHAITLQVQVRMKLRIKASHIFKLGVRNRLESESVMPVIFKKTQKQPNNSCWSGFNFLQSSVTKETCSFYTTQEKEVFN